MLSKLQLLFTTSRPISWVNTAYPFAAGYLVCGGAVDARLIVGTLFFLIPYNLLMYGINDVFDYESDILNPRKGGVEGAVTAKKYHPLIVWSSVLLSLPFVALLIAMTPAVSWIVLAALLFFVVAYSAKGLRFKEVPFLDSITSSIHFVGPLVYALSILGFPAVAWPAVIAFFLWGMASHAFGAVQDIVPDREAGIGSIATVMGARVTVWFSVLCYSAAAILVSLYGLFGLIIGISGLFYVWNVLGFTGLTDKLSGRARAGWKRFLWLNYSTGAVVTICLLMLYLWAK